MFSRKFSNTIRRKKRLIISTIIALVIFLGIGYSFFYSDFSFTGSLTVSGYLEPTLYNVLKKEAVTNGLAREYTGSHGDSMDSSLSTEKIYHWYAENSAQNNQILNKNNVIFAGQCWQMIRTTDTGGVKLIYNGEAENGKCLSTRGNHIGYASRTSQSLNSNYWYGTDYTYDSSTSQFSIAGTTEQTTWDATTGPTLIGKYTCKQTTEAGTCANLYLIESYNSTTSAYVIPLNSSSHYSQFGTLQFNANDNSPADVGYMYNTRYTPNSRIISSYESILSHASLDTNYWYADSVTYGSPNAYEYSLDNPYQLNSTDDYANLVGKYTFRKTSQTYTNSSIYYILAVNSSTMYYIQLEYGHNLAYYNDTYTYGDSYRDNNDGTYTLLNQDESNPTIIERKNWYTSYSSVGSGKYICKNAVNDTCNELWYTTNIDEYEMRYISSINNYKFAKSFEYKLDLDDNTYKYFLDDDTSTTFFEWNDTNKTSINNAHFTCWNKDGKCTTISYIYYIDDITPYYINISNGKSVVDAINEMLYANDVNQVNSIMKSGVDAWYKNYIYPYDSYVEDTIFCNDRSISNADTNGWNPNGGSTSTYMYFKDTSVDMSLSCTNVTDKFSVSNPSANLTYKVGLITASELKILSNGDPLLQGNGYWLGTPYYYERKYAIGRSVTNYLFAEHYMSSSRGVRPTISLKSGTEYFSGDGSMANPYYVGEVYNITNSNNMFNVKKQSPPGYDVTIRNDDYVVTSFKLNGNLVNGDTFIMPSEDVTITDIQYIDANYSITNTDSSVTVPSTGRYNSTITLEAEGYLVTSFKLNGTLINGNSFIMPAENVTITEITKIPQVTIESDHNPYPNNENNVVYYENTFSGATSLTVELTYQTESTTYDWIYLYDDENSTTPVNNKKYGGTTLKTETITINTNYLKILFKTDSGGNNYYGFKAVITPNYD